MTISEYCEKCNSRVDRHDLRNFIEQYFFEVLKTYYEVLSKQIVDQIAYAPFPSEKVQKLNEYSCELHTISQLIGLGKKYKITVYPSAIEEESSEETEEEISEEIGGECLEEDSYF